MGDGNLLPGFERALYGLRAGDQRAIVIEPSSGFGEPLEDNVQKIKRHLFDPTLELQPGMVVSFDNGKEGEVPGVVLELDEQYVTMDFNHPLAGRDLTFEVKIIDVQPAPQAVQLVQPGAKQASGGTHSSGGEEAL